MLVRILVTTVLIVFLGFVSLIESLKPPSIIEQAEPIVVVPLPRGVPIVVTEPWMMAMRQALPNVLRDYGHSIVSASRQEGLDPKIVAGVLLAESIGIPESISKKNAKGCMQTLKIADVDIGMQNYDSFNCHISIKKGSKYLALLRDRYGFKNPFISVLAYRDGPGNAKHYSKSRAYKDPYLNKVWAVMEEIPDDAFL